MIRFFRVFIPTTVFVLILVDAIVLFASYVGMTALILGSEYELRMFLIEDLNLARIAVVVVMIIGLLYLIDLYTNLRVRDRFGLLQQLLLAFGAVFIGQAVVGYVNRSLILPPRLMITGSTVALVGIFAWRLFFSAKLVTAGPLQRVLFLGSSPLVFHLAEHLRDHPELGFVSLGFLSELTWEDGAMGAPTGLPCLGNVRDVAELARSVRPDRITVGMSERRSILPVQELLDLRFQGVRTEEIADLYEITFSRVCAREIRPSKLLFSEVMGPGRYSTFVGRLYSRVLALIGLLLASPVMLLVAALVKVTSPGPVFFRQSRIGLNNVPFTLLKFRSMHRDAEAVSGAVWAQKNDPRVTPAGFWLRRLRLDELPQLINVLRGEMSIVGPRPERPEFVTTLAKRIPYYRQRHSVMPGITGWAQINYKYGDTDEDTMMKLEYDLYYVKHISLALDLYIMFHTAKTMVTFRGAQ